MSELKISFRFLYDDTAHLNSGSTEFLAELRPISVIFVSLSFSYSPGKLTKIQEAMCAMQQAVAHYEGTVRQVIEFLSLYHFNFLYLLQFHSISHSSSPIFLSHYDEFLDTRLMLAFD